MWLAAALAVVVLAAAGAIGFVLRSGPAGSGLAGSAGASGVDACALPAGSLEGFSAQFSAPEPDSLQDPATQGRCYYFGDGQRFEANLIVLVFSARNDYLDSPEGRTLLDTYRSSNLLESLPAEFSRMITLPRSGIPAAFASYAPVEPGSQIVLRCTAGDSLVSVMATDRVGGYDLTSGAESLIASIGCTSPTLPD